MTISRRNLLSLATLFALGAGVGAFGYRIATSPKPFRDIKIIFTGLRPGEKLYEELSFDDERIKPTSHEAIRVFGGGQVKFEQVRTWLDALSTAVEAKNAHYLIQSLLAMVPEYSPSEEIRALLELDRHDMWLTYRQKRPSLSLVAGEEAA